MSLGTDVAGATVRRAIISGVCGLIVALACVAAWYAYRGAYERGAAAERETWQKAQRQADDQQREREATDKAASAAASSQLAASIDNRTTTAAAGATARREAITHEYKTQPAQAAPCTADGRPAAIPDGVLYQLREAKRAAQSAGR